MSAAFDTTGGSVGNTGTSGQATPYTRTITVTPTGSDRLVIFQLTWVSVVGNTIDLGSPYTSTPTYDGNNMTFLASANAGSWNNDFWYYVNPPASAKVISVDWNDDDDGNFQGTWALAYSTFTGVHQTTPIAQSGTNTGAATPITKTLTTASADNMLIDTALLVRGSTSNSATVGADQTQRQNQLTGSSLARYYALMSTQPATGGADVMSWTINVTDNSWGTVVAELGASAAATSVKDLIQPGFIPFPR